MSLGLGLCLRPQLELRHELRQELRLQLKVMAPDRQFREPEPLKPIERIDGRPVIRITSSELKSYTAAVRSVSGIIEQEAPNIVFISMRGALPLFRATMQAMNPRYLDHEAREAADWSEKKIRRTAIVEVPSEHILRSFAKTPLERARIIRKYGQKKEISFLAVKAKTSYFLSDLSGDMEECLLSTFEHFRGKKPITAVFLDTSVTGTKLGWFLPQFEDALRQIASGLNKMITLINVIVHHGKEGMLEKRRSWRGGSLETVGFDIGVESLITEDNPSLLGASYELNEVHAEAQGQILACQPPARASILVGNELYDIRSEKSSSTATLFARIAGNAAGLLEIGGLV